MSNGVENAPYNLENKFSNFFQLRDETLFHFFKIKDDTEVSRHKMENYA